MGINRLLAYGNYPSLTTSLTHHFDRYIESGGEGAIVRPWVWCFLMFLGPFVGTLAMQYYTFITVRASHFIMH